MTASRGHISCQRTISGGSHPCRRYRTVSETKGRTVCPATFTKIRGASIVGVRWGEAREPFHGCRRLYG